MKPSEFLVKVKEKIDTPDKWAKGTFAVDENGRSIDASSPNACRFCIYGALDRVQVENEEVPLTTRNMVRYAISDKIKAMTGKNMMGIVGFNDDYANHDQLMEMFDGAIVDLNKKGL